MSDFIFYFIYFCILKKIENSNRNHHLFEQTPTDFRQPTCSWWVKRWLLQFTNEKRAETHTRSACATTIILMEKKIAIKTKLDSNARWVPYLPFEMIRINELMVVYSQSISVSFAHKVSPETTVKSNISPIGKHCILSFVFSSSSMRWLYEV